MKLIARCLLSLAAVAVILFVSFWIFFSIALQGCCGAPSHDLSGNPLYPSENARMIMYIGIVAVDIILSYLILRWGFRGVMSRLRNKNGKS